MKLEVICLHQLFKECKCEVDTDETHYPNNYDCPDYYPITIRTFRAEKDLYTKYP